MNTLNRQMGRREFLKKATQAAATVAVSAGMASAAEPKDKTGDPVDAIPNRLLGKTGLKLPMLGYGGAALPKAWLNPLSDQARVELVRYAYDRGDISTHRPCIWRARRFSARRSKIGAARCAW